MKQRNRNPDEVNVTSQGVNHSFDQGLMTNNTMSLPYNSLSKSTNFEITADGSLITRPGLVPVIDIRDGALGSKPEKLYKYETFITDYYRQSPDVEDSSSNILFGELTALRGVFIKPLSKITTVLIKTTCGSLTISDYGIHNVKDLYFQIDNKGITIIDNPNNDKVLEAVVPRSEVTEPTIRDNTARGLIEVAICLKEKRPEETHRQVIVYTRYSKLSYDVDKLVEEGRWEWSGVIDNLDLYRDEEILKYYNTKRLFTTISDDHVYIKTINGLYMLQYEPTVIGIRLVAVNLMDPENYISKISRYSPNPSEITVAGYNLLSKNPESEVEDEQGTVNAVLGIIAQGVEISNRTQPFKTNQEIMFRALVSYLTEDAYASMKFHWSIDYIGSSYTTNISIKKRAGDDDINDGYTSDNMVYFTPTKAGMYRVYVQMEIPNSSGNYEDSGIMIRRAFADISVEDGLPIKVDEDELYLYEGLKRSRIMRRFKEYYVVGGAYQLTNYSSIIYISAPNNMTYFPANYVYYLPSGVFVSDFIPYGDNLLIFTNDGVYELSGDVPYTVEQLSTDKTAKAFSISKKYDTINCLFTDNIGVTSDGIINVSDVVVKLFDTLSKNSRVNRVGDVIPEYNKPGGFDFVQTVNDRTYLVNRGQVLVYDTLNYSITGISNRFFYYDFGEEIVRHIFYNDFDTMVVLESGLVCKLDDESRGYDLSIPFEAEMKTNANYFGDPGFPKKFKTFTYAINPVMNNNTKDEDGYSYVQLPYSKEMPDDLEFACNVWLDNEHTLKSRKETEIERAQEWLGYEEKNLVVKAGTKMIAQNAFLTYGRKDWDNIYKRERPNQQDVDDNTYLGEVRLRGRNGHKSVRVQMKFDAPVFIRNIGFDYKVKKATGDYSGNNFNNKKRLNR